jgi:CRP-like cAMP-binding protein
MKALDKNLRWEIINEMSLCKINSGEIIFNQGSIGNYFYIVKEGNLQLTINEKPVKLFGYGDSFGELALLHCCERSGSVSAINDSLLWVLERKTFRKVVEQINSSNFEENKKFIQSIPILQSLDNDQITILSSNLIKSQYEARSLIVKHGDAANCLYIVKEGEVECISKDKVRRILSKGDHFGERAILLDSKRTMDVIAKSKSTCYSISIDTLKNILGNSYRDILYLSFMNAAFLSSKFLKKLNLNLIESMYKLFKPINYLKNDVVLNKGYIKSSKLIIIIDGGLIKVNFILTYSKNQKK